MTRKPTRKPVDVEFFGIKFTTTPLEYKVAEDHLAEVLLITTKVFDRAMQEVDPAIVAVLSSKKLDEITPAELVKLMPALSPIALTVFGELGNGVLKRLAPVIFSTTDAIVTNEQGIAEKLELMKESDRALLFDEHPETYLASLFFAGWVTYGRFFPVKDLIAKAQAKAQAMGVTMPPSSPVTTAAAPTTS